MFYAHSTERQDRSDWQPLREHLEKVADGARSNAAKINAGELDYLVGLLHDLGKYSPDFQRERLGKKNGKRVDHSTAGAVVAERYGSIGRLVAFCIAGHHAGLANGVNGDAISALTDRLSSKDTPHLDQRGRTKSLSPNCRRCQASISAIPSEQDSSWHFSRACCFRA